jgi:hypothetical protein
MAAPKRKGPFRGTDHGMRAVLLCLMTASSTAIARPPACFPERTIMVGAHLYDLHGDRAGVARAGHVVTVMEDGVGDKGEWALVDVGPPLTFTARVRRDQLYVFTRREITIEPGRAWWLKGASLRVESAEPGRALVRSVHLGIACADLSGGPVESLRATMCHGAVRSKEPSAAGTPVYWDYGSREICSTRHRSLCVTDFRGGLLKKGRDRVLVVFTTNDLRMRGWVRAEGMKHGESDPGVSGTCREEGPLTPFGHSRAILAKAASIMARPGGTPFAVLPAGTAVRRVAERGQWSEVTVWWPKLDPEAFTLAVRGWVPSAALPVQGPIVRQALILGRTSQVGDHRRTGMMAVVTDQTDDDRVVQAPVDREGRFSLRLKFPWKRHRVEIRDAAGQLLGAVDGAWSALGGDAEVLVPIGSPLRR